MLKRLKHCRDVPPLQVCYAMTCLLLCMNGRHDMYIRTCLEGLAILNLPTIHRDQSDFRKCIQQSLQAVGLYISVITCLLREMCSWSSNASFQGMAHAGWCLMACQEHLSLSRSEHASTCAYLWRRSNNNACTELISRVLFI